MKLPTEWKTVKQPDGSKVCNAAVAAMAVGESLEYATSHMEPFHDKDGREFFGHYEVIKFLAEHGITMGLAPNLDDDDGQFERDMDITFKFKMQDIIAILTVPSCLFGFDHAVFWDGQHVRDPNSAKPETTDIEDYKILEITPLVYIDDKADHEHH